MKISILIFISLIFYGCVKNVEVDPISSSQWEVFGYFPVETQFVLYMNLNELRKTEFWVSYFEHSLKQNQKNPGEMDVHKWLTEFGNETGVGLNGGVSEIFTASTWEGNNIIAVSFDKNFEKIRNYFSDEDNFEETKKGNREIFTSKSKTSADFYFPNDSLLLIINDDDYVDNLLEDNGKSLKDNKKLIGVIKKIRNKKHYWMATDKGNYAAALFENLLNVNQDLKTRDFINSIEEISLSAEFQDGVNIESLWNCNSSKNAYLLATAIRGALAMDLFKSENNTLGKLLEKMEIERENSQINIQIDIDKSDIEEIKNLAKKDLIQKKL